MFGELTYQNKIYELSEMAYLMLNKLTEFKNHVFVNILASIFIIKKDMD